MVGELKRGIDAANQAVKHDNNGDMKMAYEGYRVAIDLLGFVVKHEDDVRMKSALEGKISQYKDRSCKISEALHIHNIIKSPEQATTTTTTTTDEATIRDITEVAKVEWCDVAGLKSAKDSLKEAAILPWKFPHLFQGAVKPWRCILLYGPPGTGKSYLAKALATESESSFYAISASDILSKWVGESEQQVKDLFETARRNTPAIIFVDEVDSLCGSRDGENDSSRRVTTEFLVQIQGVGNNNDGVLLLAATNTPWSLDNAMRRRFEKRIYIPLPTFEARVDMFRLHVGDNEGSIDMEALAGLSEGYSGSDIELVVREAGMSNLRLLTKATHFMKQGEYMVPLDGIVCEDCDASTTPCEHAIKTTVYDLPPDCLKKVHHVSMYMLKEALKKSKPTVSTEDLTLFDKWTEKFGEDGR